MSPADLLLIFFALCLAGALASLLLPSGRTPAVVAVLGSLASGALIAAGIAGLVAHEPVTGALWRLPALGSLRYQVDPLSSLFLLLAGGVALPVSVFSHGYLGRYEGRYALGPFGALYHLLLASIAAVLVTGDVLSFLIAWEAMSVLSYLLVCFEHEQERAPRAGLSMLAMGEMGTLAAAVGLLLLAARAGGLDFASLRAAAAHSGGTLRWTVFGLTFLGFGVKAGLVPVSGWLPRAHPAAPANVSALLSGVILNLGLYGILRVALDLAPTTSVNQGLVVVVVGSVSALVGILYATTENDLKRMLAHSSIENMGLITAGFGASLVFAASGHPALAAMATVAASYHLVNHSLYKALLFLGAGAVDQRVGHRDLNRLGGLIRVMPATAFFFLVGALAIAALPPLNGFVSEWLTLQTFLQSASLGSRAVRVTFVLCGAALGLTVALAATAFVKAFAMGFLGHARSKEAAESRPAPRSARAAMAGLAVACLALGVTPTYVIPALDYTLNWYGGEAVAPVAPVDQADPRVDDLALLAPSYRSAVETLVPAFFTPDRANPPLAPAFLAEFHDLGAQVGKGILPGRGLVVLHRGSAKNPVVFAMSTAYMAIVLTLLLALLVGGVALATRGAGRRIRRRAPWFGGVPEIPPEMTYTATGFSNPVRVVFNAVFRPTRDETRQEIVADHFRSALRENRQEDHLADRWVVTPALRAFDWLSHQAARLHSGRVNAYAAYVLLALLLALLLHAL